MPQSGIKNHRVTGTREDGIGAREKAAGPWLDPDAPPSMASRDHPEIAHVASSDSRKKVGDFQRQSRWNLNLGHVKSSAAAVLVPPPGSLLTVTRLWRREHEV